MRGYLVYGYGTKNGVVDSMSFLKVSRDFEECRKFVYNKIRVLEKHEWRITRDVDDKLLDQFAFDTWSVTLSYGDSDITFLIFDINL